MNKTILMFQSKCCYYLSYVVTTYIGDVSLCLDEWLIWWLKTRVKTQQRDTPRGHVPLLLKLLTTQSICPLTGNILLMLLEQLSLRTRSQILHLSIWAASVCEQASCPLNSTQSPPPPYTAHYWLPTQDLMFPSRSHGSCGPLQIVCHKS